LPGFAAFENLVPGMVGVSSKNCERPIDLLSENYPRKLVRQSDSAQREEKVGSFQCHGRPAVCRSNSKYQALCSIIPQTTHARGELIG
jgi:hypothetical protein